MSTAGTFEESRVSREASAGTVRTRTGSGVVEDHLYESAVDRRQLRTRRIVVWGGVAVILALVVLGIVG